MKKATVLIVGLLFFLNRPVVAETITVAVGEWPPYTSQFDPNAKLAQKIVTEAFALQGVDVIYHYYPWKRCYVEVEKGRITATLPWYRNEARDRTFLFNQEPLIHDKEVFFHLKTLAFQWDNLDDLKRYRVGGTLGYFDTDLLEKHGVVVDKVADENLNFEKMLVGRLDVYATTIDVGYYLINKLYGPAKAALFTHHSKPLHEADAFVMFSRKVPGAELLRQKLDEGLRQLKASGRYNEILAGASGAASDTVRP